MFDTNSDIFKVYAYLDADFARIYGHKNHYDSACSNKCIGFIITFYDFPVLCISTLQTKPSLSKMEAEKIALANCCQELFQIININQSLRKEVVLTVGVTLM